MPEHIHLPASARREIYDAVTLAEPVSEEEDWTPYDQLRTDRVLAVVKRWAASSPVADAATPSPLLAAPNLGVASDLIDLYVECRDVHGQGHEQAKATALQTLAEAGDGAAGQPTYYLAGDARNRFFEFVKDELHIDDGIKAAWTRFEKVLTAFPPAPDASVRDTDDPLRSIHAGNPDPIGPYKPDNICGAPHNCDVLGIECLREPHPQTWLHISACDDVVDYAWYSPVDAPTKPASDLQRGTGAPRGLGDSGDAQ